MGAVASLIDTIVAKPPVAFVAIVALPIAGVGMCFAYVAEDARLSSLSRIVLAGEHVRRR